MERLINYFVPTEYELEECISRETREIQGKVEITGHFKDENQVIKFHAKNQKIINIEYRLFGNDAEDNLPFEYKKCDFQYDGEIITIPVTADMHEEISLQESRRGASDEDEHVLQFKIIFEAVLNQNLQGCYLSTYDFQGEEKRLVTTQFESHYAREAFPCIDEPEAKAVFNLTLVVPDLSEQDVVLANTPIIKQDVNRFEFAPTPKMSTYLLAWVIGPLKGISTVNQHGVKVSSYCALNQNTSTLEFANEVAAEALDYYDQKFGIKYPLEKLDQVALPDFEAGAMENWGLVTYRESCMLAGKDSSVDTKQSVAITVTHELSHQWFGDLVTMKWWDDLWLNESFATIMEYYATDALHPELQAWQDFYTGDCVAALRRDALRGVQAVQQAVHDPAEIATLFDSAIVYAKGARLVLMLMHLMGEANFYKGVHDYFVQYQYQNTVGDDLWNALQPYADFDVKDFMHAWISQPGYPALQQAHNGDKTWWEQQRFLLDGTTDESKWPLSEVKDDMSGHYLIDLGDDEFQQKLAQYDQLNLEQKLRLLIDRSLLAKAGHVHSATLLDLLLRCTQENAAVWDIMLDIINDLKIFCVNESVEEKLYKKYLRNLIHARLQAVGVEPQTQESSDIKRLRNILCVLARYADEMAAVQQLAQMYDADLSKLNAELRGNILTAKLKIAEADVFAELLQKYQTENDPEIKDDILGALATVQEEVNIDTMIELLQKPEIVRPQDHLFLCVYLLRNFKARAKTFAWIYAHWDYIVAMNGEKSVEDYPRCMASYINNRKDAQEFYNFFAAMENDPVLKRTLALAKVSIEAKLSLIKRESSAVHEKLKTLVEE